MTPDHILEPPLQDTGPLETMAREIAPDWFSEPVKEIWAAAAVFQRGSGKIDIFLHAGPTEAEALGRAVAGNKDDGSPMIAKVTLLCASVNEDGGSNNG